MACSIFPAQFGQFYPAVLIVRCIINLLIILALWSITSILDANSEHINKLNLIGHINSILLKISLDYVTKS